ncbi:MAG: DnaJ domain-containing protein [Desulfobacteraceae bacterium]|nr:DnaJ domain-containing protein [Desulfobacteraceae bacterium]
MLGVERSASLEEIKRAYREQANRYHPDKVSHLGEEFQEMAKRKFQEIQWAYEKLAAERNSS